MVDRLQQRTSVVVTRIEMIAESVCLIELARRDAGDLPVWQPGAHIELDLMGRWKRQYSLCGDPADFSRWQIAVLEEPDSRGGSRYIHRSLKCGDELVASGPVNRFEFVEADRYMFVGGGIGITPLIPMLAAAEKAGAEWRLHYGGRSIASMSFVNFLQETYGEKVTIVPQDRDGILDIERLLSSRHADEQVYCCGPEGLLDAVETAYNRRDLPDDELHMERFRGTADSSRDGDHPFVVTIASTGEKITVGPQCSILTALNSSGYDLDFSCGEGTCGSCETGVIDGVPDHRDSVLSKNERASGDTIITCVSRAVGETLTLDL
ncbi:PDR/VanB family oxidoreductase [Nocardia vaccinii]|uniref:PDR/VanB family oxidoreductase n=1 Tax=Nocardia vaccinii TaxID=1822 RepID=UPI000A04E7E5|nr:PDR/VanB family oxidoreductase [Nocardia vaccinii]